MPTPFDAAYQEHLPYVTRMSRKLARGDRDLAGDLSQEAWLALISTPDTHYSEPRYVRTVLTRAMYDCLARERARQVVTLESRPYKPAPERHDVFKFRRNVPRPHVHAVTPLHQLNRRTASS